MTTHLNKKNKPQMVDINKKKKTSRTALAEGEVKFNKITFNKIEKMKTKKGKITNIAILAGIMGAKKTSDLIPLCHNIGIEKVNIDIKTNKKKCSLIVIANVKTSGKTGVEMEALTAVSITCLTIYDMCKSLDKSILIKNIKLINKTGGKSDYSIIENY
jgi:molybdenum cofactor biosynthesis protein MoaC